MLPHLTTDMSTHNLLLAWLQTILPVWGSLTAWAYSHGSNSPHLCIYIQLYIICGALFGSFCRLDDQDLDVDLGI